MISLCTIERLFEYIHLPLIHRPEEIMSSNQPVPPADVDSDEEEFETTKPEATPAEAEPAEDTSLANSDVVTKYQEAAKIVQAALLEVQRLVCHYYMIYFSFML